MKADGTTFSCFVQPKIPVQFKASQVTGIKLIAGKLYHRGRPVEALSVSTAFDRFMDFLGDSKKNLLIGHNCKSYDCPIIFNALSACEKLSVFPEYATSFLDTLKLFKIIHPGLPSYTQTNLVAKFLKEKYAAHDARADVLALKGLYMFACDSASPQAKKEASFTFSDALESHHLSKRVTVNLPSLQSLVDGKVVSVGMARKIAGSGLHFSHLKLAHQRGGREGIQSVLSEKNEHQSVRVTKSAKVIDSLSEYFRSCEE